MLDRAGMGEAEPVGFFRQRQRFGEIVPGALAGGPDAGEKLHTELHGCNGLVYSAAWRPRVGAAQRSAAASSACVASTHSCEPALFTCLQHGARGLAERSE